MILDYESSSKKMLKVIFYSSSFWCLKKAIQFNERQAIFKTLNRPKTTTENRIGTNKEKIQNHNRNTWLYMEKNEKNGPKNTENKNKHPKLDSPMKSKTLYAKNYYVIISIIS